MRNRNAYILFGVTFLLLGENWVVAQSGEGGARVYEHNASSTLKG